MDLPVDTVVYPIVFLYRHYFELMLKRLIRSARAALGERATSPDHHKLSNLWATARNLVETAHPDGDWVQNAIVTRLFEELDTLDPNSEESRFPVRRKGGASFADVPLLHVRHFALTAERLADYLEDLAGGTDYLVEERAALAIEMRSRGE